MVRALLAAALFALALIPVLPAGAATAIIGSVDSEPADTPAPQPAQTIDTGSSEDADARIAQRILGIFSAVPALGKVTVDVSEGVVTLKGKVPAQADIDRAEQIASRVAGVVTVENGIRRDVSLDENISTLGGVSGKVSEFVRLLPLIGVALLVAGLIALIGYALAALSWLWQRITPNSFLAELIASAIRFFFVIGGIVVALEMVGAGALLGAVLGGAGIIGIALGFAMRDTIENYVASIMLSVRQPFRANDWVVIDNFEGRVIRLTSRATILMTLDGNHLRIPNAMVFKAVILNYTRNPQRRFEFELGIDAEDDPNAARTLGVDILSGLGFVLDDPPPSARLEHVGDSNIVIKFLAWIDQDRADWYKARSEAIPAVKAALEEAGFALPEPIYRLRFDQGAPLPLRNLGEGEAEAERKPVKATVTVDESEDAVAPDESIAGMVEEERRSGPEARKDLLDSRRPVE